MKDYLAMAQESEVAEHHRKEIVQRIQTIREQINQYRAIQDEVQSAAAPGTNYLAGAIEKLEHEQQQLEARLKAEKTWPAVVAAQKHLEDLLARKKRLELEIARAEQLVGTDGQPGAEKNRIRRRQYAEALTKMQKLQDHLEEKIAAAELARDAAVRKYHGEETIDIEVFPTSIEDLRVREDESY